MSYPYGAGDYGRQSESFDDHPAHPGRLRKAFAVLLVMGLFAGGLWFAYREGARHAGGIGNIPLIRADTRPFKVRPNQPGGLQIPDRGMLIYNPDRPMADHLLPPPEQPLPRPAPPAPPAPATAPSPPPEAVPQPASQAPSAEPASNSVGNAPQPIGGDIRLQLGALPSEEAARREWDRIKARNPDLLGKLSASVVRADLGEKGVYYRIQAGPIGSAAAAEEMCSKLRQRSGGCLLVR